MELLNQISELLPISSPFELIRVEKDETALEVHLYLGVSKSYLPSSDHCIHSYYPRQWEHLKLFQYRTFIHCDLPIYRHKLTGKLEKAAVSFSRDFSRFTLLYEQEIMRLMRIHLCFTTVAKQMNINVQRVETIYHFYTKELDNPLMDTVCSDVGYDETSTRKGHDYITVFVDMKTHKVIDIYDGKSAECVEQFFQAHPYPEAVKNISIDMSPAFISGAKTFFPQAKLTFDKWHVIKLLYKHLGELDKKAYVFKNYIELLMADLVSFFNENDCLKAKAQICFIADFAQEQMGNNPISKTILRHFDGIAQYVESKLSNGLLEGMNSKIQTIKRIAKGFRYKQNFKKMIRFAFNSQVLSSKIT
jgi:transposase